MRIVKTICLLAYCGLAISGCGDITVNQPSRPVIIEEKKSPPVIVEKTIVEKTTVEKPTIIIEKK